MKKLTLSILTILLTCCSPSFVYAEDLEIKGDAKALTASVPTTFEYMELTDEIIEETFNDSRYVEGSYNNVLYWLNMFYDYQKLTNTNYALYLEYSNSSKRYYLYFLIPNYNNYDFVTLTKEDNKLIFNKFYYRIYDYNFGNIFYNPITGSSAYISWPGRNDGTSNILNLDLSNNSTTYNGSSWSTCYLLGYRYDDISFESDYFKNIKYKLGLIENNTSGEGGTIDLSPIMDRLGIIYSIGIFILFIIIIKMLGGK